jgi:hypothetical protein
MTRVQLQVLRTTFVLIGFLLINFAAIGFRVSGGGDSLYWGLLILGLALYFPGIYVWVVHLKGKHPGYIALGLLGILGLAILCFLEDE